MQVIASAIGLAKVGVAGSNPVVRSIQVQVSGLSGPLLRVRGPNRDRKSVESPRRRFGRTPRRGQRAPVPHSPMAGCRYSARGAGVVEVAVPVAGGADGGVAKVVLDLL